MELDENTALAIIFSNIRRKKRDKDLLTISESFDFLVKLYGSRKAVAEKVGLSPEMVREFLIAVKLPKEIQGLIRERKIDSVDSIREIYTVKDKKKQITISNRFKNSGTKDFRDINRLMKVAEVPIDDAIDIVSKAKPEGLHIFMMDFDDETYSDILRNASLLKVEPAELVKKIVQDWLNNSSE